MDKNKDVKTKRILIFLIITALVSASIAYAESIPNHSMKNGAEYSLWLTLSVFPIVFALYGIFSGAMLGKKHRILFFTISPLWLFMLFFLQRFLYEKMVLKDSLISALAGVVLYSVCMFAGCIFYVITNKIIFFLFIEKSS